jgi:hypothetical protein
VLKLERRLSHEGSGNLYIVPDSAIYRCRAGLADTSWSIALSSEIADASLAADLAHRRAFLSLPLQRQIAAWTRCRLRQLAHVHYHHAALGADLAAALLYWGSIRAISRKCYIGVTAQKGTEVIHLVLPIASWEVIIWAR